ncbi:MAG TPA: type II toxin-antitoxin system VapC family toxin [Caulobacterales bacterium]|nr:type II toxin-antitoxin system VapC family toxin [Caulobacterales bacterium]
MRAVDTNILVRLITRDDAKQVAAAEAFVARGAWASHLVLAETMWVLESVYDFETKQIALTVEMLLNHAQLSLQDADVVAAALISFRRRPSSGFSDHLIVEIARKNGHAPLGTFDKNLAAIDGVERI